MTPLAFASRMAARRRRMVLRSAIPLGAAAFFLVLASALLLSVREQISGYERLHLSGEVAGTSTEPGDIQPAGDILFSSAFVTPAVVTNGSETKLCMVVFTHVEQELAFRGMSPVSGNSGLATPGLPEGELSVSVPGLPSVTVSPVRTDELVGKDPIIILPWEAFPSEIRPGSGDATDSAVMVGNYVTRARGVLPLDRAEEERLIQETGLSPTGWRSIVRERMRVLWALAGLLAGLLYIAGGLGTAPSVAIMVRRYAPEFQLLAATGYTRGWISASVAAMGGLAGAVASAVGAVAAALVVTIAGMRGGFDPSFLPLFWLEANPAPGVLLPGPPVIPAMAGIVAGAIAGALFALPSARLVATVQEQGQP